MDIPDSFQFDEPTDRPMRAGITLVSAPRVGLIHVGLACACFVVALIASLADRRSVAMTAMAMEAIVVAVPPSLLRRWQPSTDVYFPRSRMVVAGAVIITAFVLCLAKAPNNVARVLMLGAINIFGVHLMLYLLPWMRAFTDAGNGRDTRERRRERHQQASSLLGARLSASSPSPLVVYLRAFSREDAFLVNGLQRLRWQWKYRRLAGPLVTERRAELVAQALSRLAWPAGEFPIVVAARNTKHYSFFLEDVPTFSLSDRRWMDAVAFLLEQADAIVILVEGSSDGLGWERDTILRSGYAGKTLEITTDLGIFDQTLHMADYRLDVVSSDTLDSVTDRLAERLRLIMHRQRES